MLLTYFKLMSFTKSLNRFIYEVWTINFYGRCAWIGIFSSTNIIVSTITNLDYTFFRVDWIRANLISCSRSGCHILWIQNCDYWSRLTNFVDFSSEIAKCHYWDNFVHIFVVKFHQTFGGICWKSFHRLPQFLSVIFLYIWKLNRHKTFAAFRW